MDGKACPRVPHLGRFVHIGVYSHPPTPLEATMLKSNMRHVNNYYYSDDEPSEHAIIVHPHPLLLPLFPAWL